MKTFIFLLTVALTSTASALEGDLQIDYAYYQTSFAKFTCDANENAALAKPAIAEEKNLSFEKVEVSITLDKALLHANFTQDGVPCRYNAIFKVDKRKFHRTLTLEQSQAFALDGTNSGACEVFRADLDRAVSLTPYKIDHDFVSLYLQKLAKTEECASGDLLTVFKRIRRH